MLEQRTLDRYVSHWEISLTDKYKNLDLRNQILIKIQYLLEDFPISPERIEFIRLVVWKNGELDPGWLLSSFVGKYQWRLTGIVSANKADTFYRRWFYPPTVLFGPSGSPVGKLYISRYSDSLSLQLWLTFIPITIAKHSENEYWFDYRERASLCPDEEDDPRDGNMWRWVVQSRQSWWILYFHCTATQEDINHLNKLSRDYQTNPSSRKEYSLICERLTRWFYK